MCKQLAGIPEHWLFLFFLLLLLRLRLLPPPPTFMKIEAANFFSERLAGVCV